MEPQKFASYDEAMAYLYTLTNYEKGFTFRPRSTPKLGLERMAKLLEYIGNPELQLKAIHIAGTKGKGSTATMVSSVLSRAGYKTGLFVSPHVEDVRERIQIDGEWIPKEAVCVHLNRMYPYLKRSETREDGTYKPTFFEVFTAIAFMHFEQQKVDFAVAEVGMGGRLDTTNVLRPLVCGITPVSMDHTERLGDTLAAIAGEKAGIIKQNVPVVCGRQEPEALQVISDVSRERSAMLYRLNEELSVTHANGSISVRTWLGEIGNIRLGMPGAHQAENAATAVGLLASLQQQKAANLTDEQIRDGLAAAFAPARVELVRQKPLTVVDSSHNPASIRVLLDAVRQNFSFRRLISVFAAAQDKDVNTMLQLLGDEASHIIFTKMNNPRAFAPEQLAERATTLGFTNFKTAAEIEDALAAAEVEAADDDLICVCGSFYLAGDARKLILAKTPRSGEK